MVFFFVTSSPTYRRRGFPLKKSNDFRLDGLSPSVRRLRIFYINLLIYSLHHYYTKHIHYLIALSLLFLYYLFAQIHLLPSYRGYNIILMASRWLGHIKIGVFFERMIKSNGYFLNKSSNSFGIGAVNFIFFLVIGWVNSKQ